jgi:uncharacterized protein YggT (Ycf19 family)
MARELQCLVIGIGGTSMWYRSRYSYDPDVPARYETGLGRHRAVGALSAVVNFVFAIIYTIVGTRIVLELIGANEANRFKQFVDRVSAPLLSVFDGLLPDVRFDSFVLPLSFVFALVVYAVVHYGIRRLLFAIAYPRE